MKLLFKVVSVLSGSPNTFWMQKFIFFNYPLVKILLAFSHIMFEKLSQSRLPGYYSLRHSPDSYCSLQKCDPEFLNTDILLQKRVGLLICLLSFWLLCFHFKIHHWLHNQGLASFFTLSKSLSYLLCLSPSKLKKLYFYITSKIVVYFPTSIFYLLKNKKESPVT